MRVVGIVGHSGMGKTTLLERLIPELAGRGLRVSLVKHSHKDIDLDRPGKDSYRLREAGCHDVVVVGRNRWGVVHELREERPPDLAELLAALRPCHLVLVEGMKDEAFPKLEVWRPAVGKPLTRVRGVFAVATDCPSAVAASVPALPLDDVVAIADLVSLAGGLPPGERAPFLRHHRATIALRPWAAPACACPRSPAAAR